MIDEQIDAAARKFAESAHELADLMLAKLEAEAPDIAAKAAQALQAGERMQLLLEIDPYRPVIVWQLKDDYERPKRLMTIPSKAPTRQ